MDSQSMLQTYAENLRSGHALYVPMVERFLQYGHGNLSRRAVEQYLDHLRARGYADGSIRTVWSVLHRFFTVNGISWPFGKREAPTVRESEVYAPSLDPPLVDKIIGNAVIGRYDVEAIFCLVLSTVYGLRRVEIAGLRRDDILLDDGLVFIETKKHGRQRYHLIPPDIVRWLRGTTPDVRLPIGVTRAYDAWLRIQAIDPLLTLKKDAEHRGVPWGISWHAIRRTLDRCLLNAGLPIAVVMDFLRWKRSDVMPLRYFSSTVVTADGVQVGISATDKETDVQVFAVHPFIRRWSDAQDPVADEVE